MGEKTHFGKLRFRKNARPKFQFLANKRFLRKSQVWEQLSHFKSVQPATLIFFDINEKLDLEKLI